MVFYLANFVSFNQFDIKFNQKVKQYASDHITTKFESIQIDRFSYSILSLCESCWQYLWVDAFIPYWFIFKNCFEVFMLFNSDGLYNINENI